MLKYPTWPAIALVVLAMVACSKKEELKQDPEPQVAELPEPQSEPVQAFAYVTQLGGHVAIYSVADHSKVGEIKLGENAELLRVKGELALVAYGTPTRVELFNLKTGEKIREIVMDTKVAGIEFSDDEQQIIVAKQAAEQLAVYSLENGEKLHEIDTKPHGIHPHSIRRAPNGKHYAITLEYGNKLLVLDHDYKAVNEAPTGELPQGLAYSSDGSELFVTLARGQAVQVFNAETLELIREMPVGERCNDLSLSPDNKHVILVCSRSKQIQVLNSKTGEVEKSITAGKMPGGVIIHPKLLGSLNYPAEQK